MKLIPRIKPLLTVSLLCAFPFASPSRAETSDPDMAPDFTQSPLWEEPSTQPNEESLRGAALLEDRSVPSPDSAALRAAIDAYKTEPTAANRSAINVALAKMNLEIAQQEHQVIVAAGPEQKEAISQVEALKQFRAEQMRRLPANTAVASQPQTKHSMAQMERKPGTKAAAMRAKDEVVADAEVVGSKVKSGAKTAAIKTKDGLEAIGEKLEDGTKKAARAVGHGMKKTGQAIERATEPE